MISYIPNFAEISVADMLSQDRTKPRMVALIRARAAAVQLREDIAMDVLLSNNIDDATGALLDRWGSFVREFRGGLSDTEYRGFVRARVVANLSTGTVDELVRILALIVPDADVTHAELYPAAFALVVHPRTELTETMRYRVRNFMLDIKPGGVGLSLFEATPNPFTFNTPQSLDVGELIRIL